MDQVLEIVGLTERRRSLVRTFSGGMKRRLEIARGLLHHPTVLFLDEPTVGLDPQTRNAIWGHVRRLRDEIGITVFMTTHYMDEAENCDRIADDRPRQDPGTGHPGALKRPHRRRQDHRHRRRGATQQDMAERYSVKVQEVGRTSITSRWITGRSSCRAVVVDFGGRVKSIQVKQPSLDDVFLQLTGRAIREEEGKDTRPDAADRQDCGPGEAVSRWMRCVVTYAIWLREIEAVHPRADADGRHDRPTAACTC